MAAIRKPMTVIAGITYRPFSKRRFAEIVFCAVASHEQVGVSLSVNSPPHGEDLGKIIHVLPKRVSENG